MNNTITANNTLLKTNDHDDKYQISLKQNIFLASLNEESQKYFLKNSKLVHLTLGDNLYTPGVSISNIYFPISCVVSLHIEIESGSSAEIASIGKEGIVGSSVILGNVKMQSSATVLISGYAFKMENVQFKNFLKENFKLHQMVLKYVHYLMTQMGQNATCYRHHTIQQQLAKWLLFSVDKVNTSDLVVTQELISGVLGVRREGVTQAASNLKNDGLISYRRGHIRVEDTEGLKKTACECYPILHKEYINHIKQLD